MQIFPLKYAKNVQIMQKICRISKKHAKYKEGLTNVQQVEYAEYAKNMQKILLVHAKYM